MQKKLCKLLKMVIIKPRDQLKNLKTYGKSDVRIQLK